MPASTAGLPMMDLVNAFSSLTQAQTASAIQTRVAAKAMDAQRQQGAAALKLLEAASLTAGPGDELAAKATGLGGLLDVRG